ncbi:cystatin-A-like [Rhopilema esculentum]|uniref:cystatin-A-like n=1 Tax=Rhopilema esculentum TaxID=499914 RepID=UPI0031CFF492|eukprot:gene1856-16349_t
MSVPGGFGPVTAADEKTQKLINAVKPQVEEKLGKDFQVYKAVTYREQVVAGSNYLVKVNVGNGDYIHLLIFEDLPCSGSKIVLTGIEVGKTPDDDLSPFEGFRV